MGKNVLDKVKKLDKKRSRYTGSTKGIFFDFKPGDNIIRLIGEFLELKTHFIQPYPPRKDRGLCMGEAFEKDKGGQLQATINCLDWDVNSEQAREKKVCPICLLCRIARDLAKDPTLPKDKRDFYDDLAQKASPRTILKWNIIDRVDPKVVLVTDKGEDRVPGIKVAKIGMEAWNDISGIFKQCNFDIADIEDGIDINVIRTEAKRTQYQAMAVLEGGSVKKTPLTEEERELELHDLRKMNGRMVDQEALLEALHGDLRELIDQHGEKYGGIEEQEEDDSSDGGIEEDEEEGKIPYVEAASGSKKKSKDDEEDDSDDDEEDDSDDDEESKDEDDEDDEEESKDDSDDEEESKDDSDDDEESKDDSDDDEEEPVTSKKNNGDAPVGGWLEDQLGKAESEKEWECFGTIDQNHPECQQCVSRVTCAEEKGEELKKEFVPPSKKGAAKGIEKGKAKGKKKS